MKLRSIFSLMLVLTLASCSKPVTTQQDDVPQPTLDAATFQRVFAELINSSQNWEKVPPGDKIKAIAEVIRLYKNRENIAILNSPKFYAMKIDEAARTGSFPVQAPLPTLLQFFAVMEYDFYNGRNKDEFAKQILGEQLYKSVKERRTRQGLE